MALVELLLLSEAEKDNQDEEKPIKVATKDVKESPVEEAAPARQNVSPIGAAMESFLKQAQSQLAEALSTASSGELKAMALDSLSDVLDDVAKYYVTLDPAGDAFWQKKFPTQYQKAKQILAEVTSSKDPNKEVVSLIEQVLGSLSNNPPSEVKASEVLEDNASHLPEPEQLSDPVVPTVIAACLLGTALSAATLLVKGAFLATGGVVAINAANMLFGDIGNSKPAENAVKQGTWRQHKADHQVAKAQQTSANTSNALTGLKEPAVLATGLLGLVATYLVKTYKGARKGTVAYVDRLKLIAGEFAQNNEQHQLEAELFETACRSKLAKGCLLLCQKSVEAGFDQAKDFFSTESQYYQEKLDSLKQKEAIDKVVKGVDSAMLQQYQKKLDLLRNLVEEIKSKYDIDFDKYVLATNRKVKAKLPSVETVTNQPKMKPQQRT